MKTLKTIFSAFTILIIFITFAFLGCNKEKDETNQPPKDGTLKSAALRRLIIEYDIHGRVTFITCDAFWDGNCLPTVIITPSDALVAKAYNQFIQAFNNNDTRMFFNSNATKILFPNLQLLPDALRGLQTGDIMLYQIKGTNDNFDYYVGLPKEVDFNSEWKGMEKCVLVVGSSKQ